MMKYYMTPGKHGLGWLPDIPDQRDRIYSPKVAVDGGSARPNSVDLRSLCPPIYNQGQLGSCTANALAAAFDFDHHKEGESFMSPSRLFIYWNERDMEGTVDSDAGARIRDGVKSLVKLGVCPESDWPYDIAEFTVMPPAADYSIALNNELLIYQRILRPASDPTSSMIACLNEGYPFVSGITVYESFETPATAATGIIPLPTPSEAVLGGHAIVVVGYDLSTKHFICRNSWGTDWGDKGYCYLPFAYLASASLASDQWLLQTVEE
jgi:C1A family cysteine protease